MGTNIDDIILVNESEVITSSPNAYFLNDAIVAEFENAALLNSYVFST